MEYRDVGTPEQPLHVKMPDGSWRAFTGAGDLPLRQKQADGTWEDVAWSGIAAACSVVFSWDADSIPGADNTLVMSYKNDQGITLLTDASPPPANTRIKRNQINGHAALSVDNTSSNGSLTDPFNAPPWMDLSLKGSTLFIVAKEIHMEISTYWSPGELGDVGYIIIHSDNNEFLVQQEGYVDNIRDDDHYSTSLLTLPTVDVTKFHLYEIVSGSNGVNVKVDGVSQIPINPGGSPYESDTSYYEYPPNEYHHAINDPQPVGEMHAVSYYETENNSIASEVRLYPCALSETDLNSQRSYFMNKYFPSA